VFSVIYGVLIAPYPYARPGHDSPERSQPRRVLRSITMRAAGRVQDPEYLKLLERYGLRGR
jgi:hypothetical protein